MEKKSNYNKYDFRRSGDSVKVCINEKNDFLTINFNGFFPSVYKFKNSQRNVFST